MKSKKRLSVSKEFTLVSLSIIITILTLYTIIQIISFTFFSIDNQSDILDKTYSQLSYMIDSSNNIDNIDFVNSINSLSDDEYIRIYRNDKVVFDTDYSVWNNISSNTLSEFEIKFVDFKPHLLLSRNINSIYRVQILQEIEILSDYLENNLLTFIGTLVFSLILSLIGSIYLSKRFVKRLKILSSTMEDIKESNINARVPLLNTNDEFDKINILFNNMMDEIEVSFNTQNQFVSDASHELRTPLTVLQGHLKMLIRWGKNDKDVLDNSLDVCLDEVSRMIKMVNELLDLSRADKKIIDLDSVEKINPKDIILETVDNYKLLNNNINFIINIDENLNIKIKKEHLKQLLLIVIDNSLKYNDKHIIEINISLYEKDNNICLSIKDNGIGISKEHINKVMERFYKADEARINNNSFGLGLSIAKKIISLYKGDIKIESEVGKFTNIIIILNI